MNKKILSLFLLLIIGVLSLSFVVAQEHEEVEVKFLGLDLCVFFSSVLVIVFGIATIMIYKLCKKLYGGKFTNAMPYLFMASVLLLGMQVLCLFGDFVPALGENLYFIHGIQVLQLIAGLFFISALYQIYQSRFATEGFMNVDFAKEGKE